MRPSSIDRTPAALIIAHPGHELRVHHWLETARPATFVLTKGDGSLGVSRLASTTGILERAGCRRGGVYGRFDDRELYRALLARDVRMFEQVLAELVAELLALGVDYVVADAEEGYNPSHDVCRYLAGAAAAATGATRGRPVADFDFPLVGSPDACPDERRGDAVWLHLDEDAHARKMRAAHEYPELRGEVESALAALGASAFRVECLRPVGWADDRPLVRPFYEEHGERQVARGLYEEVVRYEQHVRPVRDALRAVASASVH